MSGNILSRLWLHTIVVFTGVLLMSCSVIKLTPLVLENTQGINKDWFSALPAFPGRPLPWCSVHRAAPFQPIGMVSPVLASFWRWSAGGCYLNQIISPIDGHSPFSFDDFLRINGAGSKGTDSHATWLLPDIAPCFHVKQFWRFTSTFILSFHGSCVFFTFSSYPSAYNKMSLRFHVKSKMVGASRLPSFSVASMSLSIQRPALFLRDEICIIAT